MQIVINIPEGLKLDFENEQWTALSCMEMKDAIVNGTVLPKGHGRIGDLDRLYTVFEKNVVSADAFKELFDNAPTIIEADRSEEE